MGYFTLSLLKNIKDDFVHVVAGVPERENSAPTSS